MKNKKLAVVLPLFIGGVLIIAFVVYWFLLRKKDETPTQPNLPAETLQPEPVQVAEPLEQQKQQGLIKNVAETNIIARPSLKLNTLAGRFAAFNATVKE